MLASTSNADLRARIRTRTRDAWTALETAHSIDLLAAFHYALQNQRELLDNPLLLATESDLDPAAIHAHAAWNLWAVGHLRFLDHLIAISRRHRRLATITPWQTLPLLAVPT